jgi:hypothetical protein
VVALAVALAVAWPGSAVASAQRAKLVGFAFVSANVTSQGSRAKLPRGTKIFPTGSRLTGKTACPRHYGGSTPLDGLLVVILDYAGPRTAGTATLTFTPAGSGRAGFPDAPYQLDVDPGRTLQYLGPRTQNGRYAVDVQLFGSAPQRLAGRIVLARRC